MSLVAAASGENDRRPVLQLVIAARDEAYKGADDQE
jgi:hypothetical protein